MKKMAVIGPESTGKTTLSHWLSERLSIDLVPEYLRAYCNIHGNVLLPEDMVKVAHVQMESMQKQKNDFVADTDILSLALWCELYFQHIPEQILALIPQQPFNIYLLCNIDIPWVADSQREFPHRRQEHFDLFIKYLKIFKFPYQIISGNCENRFLLAKISLD